MAKRNAADENELLTRSAHHDAMERNAEPVEPVALLRALSVRKLVELLRPLPSRGRATILAQAVHEGTMTRIWADQVLFALALDGKRKRQRRWAR